jgi:DNA processing protein
MDRGELGDWLRLTLTPGVGPQSARRLLAAFGLPAEIYQQSVTALQQLVAPSAARALQTEPAELADQLALSWSWLREAPDARGIVPLGDARYPHSLLDIEDPPLMLYLVRSTHASLPKAWLVQA